MSAEKRHSTSLLVFGLALVAIAGPLCWLLDGLRTHILFFPLWLGYTLAVQGWTLRRTGTSLLARSQGSFAALFVLSVPIWWVFELFNLRLGNWQYLGREHFTNFEYFLLASIAFSTVAPAVLSTAELLRSFHFFERFANGPRVRRTPWIYAASFVTGALMLAAMFAWPNACYPFAWTSLVLLLEPVCAVSGRKGFLDELERGDWRGWMTLWAAGLACGFFWEMWNAWSYPKWIYHIPHVGFWKLFEMPLLGYLGYLPFAMEVYLLRQLLAPEERREPKLQVLR